MKPQECYPHGQRSRYLAGCRCDDCRMANRLHHREQRAAYRAGKVPDKSVGTERALAHMKALSKQGIGRKAVSEASSIAICVIDQIKSGKKTRIRASTERRILAVTSIARLDGSHLPADRTRTLLNELREEGYTVAEIAKRLGYRKRSFEVKRYITLRNADRIERLHRALTSEALIPASFGRPRQRRAA